ncbi:MAG TPA: glutamyl-tRNA reductase [Dehalococcoidia bacterium]|nr:glutamyl-tRNA reductase [Dehalococcoidia bacterium]
MTTKAIDAHHKQIVVLGLSQKRATLALRESLSFPHCDLPGALDAMRRAVPEAAILSTCHRVELYAAVEDPRKAEAAIKRFWSADRGVPIGDFEPHVYYLTGRKAVEHLFSVASGLDSAIIGEPQILGQVREALRLGQEHRTMGPVLSTLFQHAITCGKRARTQTAIARNAASISYAAVELARKAVGNLSRVHVLLIGAGKMGELAAKHLLDRGVAGISIVGRTEERARQLALKCGNAGSLDELEDALLVSDIVISCTSAPHHVISLALMKRVMKVRGRRSILLVDIAVPRDIDPAVSSLSGVRLHNVDDLEFAVAANMKERHAEARKVTAIIEEEIADFEVWQRTLAVAPAIRALHERAEAIRREELARTAAVLDRLPEDDRRRIEALALAIEKKLLHQPIALLRAQAAAGNGQDTADALLRLFDLEVDGAITQTNGHTPAPEKAQPVLLQDAMEA